MTMVQRIRMRFAGNQASKMRHIDQKQSPDLICNGAEFGEIDLTRVRRASGYNQLWLMLFCQRLDLFKIDQVVIWPNTVLDGIKPLARLVGAGAMGQVPPRIQAHAKDCITRLQQRLEHRLICL
eukprot:CAMPEP_0195318084 /NCGR_PEP_ID=MMETSP0708-20121125/4650_1 /TAXON_ID=33640 /ORGANISM="Asterionellopsis glacialis, Strain CCMP134" /LENGTH=123 /DNA_ID=CAMNT_0040383941 /DNA_START=61 /DNA_END=432 /DNA_ORIENTATION=-